MEKYNAEKLRKNNEYIANKVIATILLVIAFLYLIVGCLMAFGVFLANVWATVGLFVFAAVMIVNSVFGLRTQKVYPWFKNLQILLLLASIFLINAAIGYKCWMLYPIPIMLSVRYYNKRFTGTVGAVAILFVVLSAFTNAYLAPVFGVIDLNLVSFAEPGTLGYYSWLHNAVLNHGYDAQRVLWNGLRLSVIPNGIAVLVSVLVGISLIDNAEQLIAEVKEGLQKEIQLLRESLLDELTELFNRRAYEKELAEIAKNDFDKNFVYIAADVNGLKTANDTLGHAAGDEIIVATAQCLTKVFGSYGKVFRIGGDEFAALICVEKEKLDALKAQFDSEVSAWKGNMVPTLSVSCGYVTLGEAGENPTLKDIAELADQRMYEAKAEYYARSGNNRRRR